MRKFITILMIIAMVSLPGRYATASGGDGGITEIIISALTKPGGFTSVIILQAVIFTLMFAPPPTVKAPRVKLFIGLPLTVTLTVVYLLHAVLNYARYYLFYAVYIQPFFLPFASPGSTVSTQTEPEEPTWQVSDPKAATAMAAAAAEEEEDEQAVIDAAVERALKDPQLAFKYLEFATPKVRDAVLAAINNQIYGNLKSDLVPIQPPTPAEAGNFSGVSAAAGQ
jgi:hypothetical protein